MNDVVPSRRTGGGKLLSGIILAVAGVTFPAFAGEPVSLFHDSFIGHAAGTPPGTPWTQVVGHEPGMGSLLVQVDADERFASGAGNQYLEYRGEGTEGPAALRALDVFSASEGLEVATFSFVFVEPDEPGQKDWISLFIYAGSRAVENRAQRILLGRGNVGGADHDFDQVIRCDVVINNSEATIGYHDGEHSLEPGRFDVWFEGELALAGGRRDHERLGPIEGFELAKATNNMPLMLFDRFAVFDGAAVGATFPDSSSGVFHYATTATEIRNIMRDHAQPGDTVVMRNGVWNDASLVFEGDGTAERPITLRAETPGEVVLTGQSRLRIGGTHLVVDGLLFTDGYLSSGSVVEFRTSGRGHASDSRLTNTGFVRYNSPDRTANYKWVSLFGRRNRVDHCRFVGMDHVGQAVTVWLDTEPNYHRIDHNFFGPRPPLGMNGGEMIRIGDSHTSMVNSRTVVEYNLFYECDGEGEIISSKSNENIFRYNTFIRSAGALTLRHGKRNRVEGNWFFGDNKPGTGGVRVVDSGHVVINNYFQDLTGGGWTPPLGLMSGKIDAEPHEHFPADDAVVAHNTFVNCERPVVIALGAERTDYRLVPKNVLMANNIVTATEGPILEIRDSNSEVQWDANLVFGATVGIARTDGVERVDPLLEPGVDGVWRPADGGPAHGAGSEIDEEVPEDIEGRLRGDPVDIGAHIIGGSEGIRMPVGFLNVGPEWMRGGWERWLGANLTAPRQADKALTAPDADALGRGVPNIHHYAFAMEPGTVERSRLPRPFWSEGVGGVEYDRPANIDDLRYVLEWSDNLENWHPAEEAHVSVENGTAARERVRHEGPADEGIRFYRLRVERVPGEW